MKLHELKRKRAAVRQQMADQKKARAGLVTEAKAIARKDDPSPDDMNRLDSIERDIDAHDQAIAEHEAAIAEHDGQIDRLERVLDLDGEGSQPVDPDDDTVDRAAGRRALKFAAIPAAVDSVIKEEPGFKAARFILGVLNAKSLGFAGAAELIQHRFGDKDVAKALNTTGVATGGALIPQAFVNELIELLRARTVVRKLQPMTLPMPMGNITIPRLAAGATSGYQGELDDIAVSQETFDDLQFNAKKLTALVPVSNDLIRRAPVGVEAIIRDDLIQSLARREDIAFLTGDGSGNSPIGLLNLASSVNKLIVSAFTDSTNATILTAVVAVLQGMVLALDQGMSRMIRPAWIFPPAVKWFLMGLRDQVGNFVYKAEMEGGTLLGFPYETTQQLPTNLTTGSGNNGAYMFLADFADVIIAETYNVTVDASDVAAYKDGGGNMVSTFQRDQSLFRVIEEHDFNIRHQASVVVATLPAWAPSGYAPIAGQAYYVQAPSGDASAAPSTWGAAAPTGSNNPGNSSANAPGGTQPGRP